MAVEDMVNDVRFEQQAQASEIIKEGLKEAYNTQGAIKDSRFDLNSRIGALGDLMDNRFFDVGRDTQDIRAQIISAQQAMVAGFLGAQKDAEINALKTQVELSKQSTYLSDKIDAGNSKTQDLINALRQADQDRALIERNTELVAALDDGRFWRHRWDDGQWQSLNTRLQAFQSDLADTRQGMVNFGTMAGVGQSSTQNQVR